MTEFYVSPLGNDASSGLSPKSAFATLDAAIKAMAADAAAATTYVLDGTHYLNGTSVALTRANSNNTITAYPGANPVISGGTPVPVSAWSIDSSGIWTAQLSTSNVEQLVVDGQRQTLARFPNKVPNNPIHGGWLWAQALPEGNNPLKQMAYDPSDFSAGRAPLVGQKITLFDAHNWTSNVVGISAIDTIAHVMTFDSAVNYYIGPGSRYFISGSRSLLDQLGEWYFDQASSTLYFRPQAGFTGAGAVISANSAIINISDAENITIKGLSLSDAATNAVSDTQIANAAVRINSSSGIAVVGNHFTNVVQGVRIDGRSSRNIILKNDFAGIWAQAVVVESGTSQNHISHNSIKNSGDVFAAASAIQLENTWNNTISNNHIRNVPRSGISDVHSDPNVKSGANVIEFNTILHSGEVTSDTGAIYLASPGASSLFRDTIKFNTIVNAGGLGTNSSGFIAGQHESAGIYVDAGVNGAEITGNNIKGTTLGSVLLHGSSNNDVHNNVFSKNWTDSESNGEVGILLVPVSGTAMTGNTVDSNAIEPLGAESSFNSTANKSASVVGDDDTETYGSTTQFSDGALPLSTALPLTVTDGGIAEIDGASGQSVSFAGDTGTLKLDDAVAYTGQVSGLTASDAFDLADVSYGADTTVTFLGNTTGGTLTVSDGAHSANIDLVGNYLSSTWDLSSDGSGGTIVVDPVASSDWQTLKVGAGGFVDGIDIAPDGLMVARTDTYGAYIWNGSEWQQLITSTSMPAAFVSQSSVGNAQGVYEIQIAPSNSNILYMAYEGYVFESSNDGTTWTETSFAPVTETPNDNNRMDGQKMAIDPENPDVVYVGTEQSGLFVTTDGGTTWESVSGVPASQSGAGIDGILFDPALGVSGGKTETIFASSYGNGVYESTNAGATWTDIGGPSDVEYATVSSTGVYYAVGDSGSSLWAYANGAWTELLSNAWIEAVAVNPANPDEIVVAEPGGALDASFNGGTTWTGVSGNELSSTDIPWLSDTGYMSIGGLAFDPLVPNELITSAGVGVWNTTLPAVNPGNDTWEAPVVWNDQSTGIEQLVANTILVAPGEDPIIGVWDRGFFTITNPDVYPSTYGPVNGSFVAGWSLDYASSDPSFIVGIADWAGVEESGYTTNDGQTWTPFPTELSDVEGGTIAASTPENIIWAPADNSQPYYTLNGGETWNPINLPGVTSWTGFDWAYYLDTRTVAADRVLPNTFYLYDWNSGLFETTNGGVSWTEVHNGPIANWSGDNALLETVPGEAGNLFFTPGNFQGLYQSTNQGETWTAVPNVEVNVFGFGAPAPGQTYPSIYIVGDVNNVYGIWQSNNDAQSWVQIGTYPDSSLDNITTISGDPNVYGQVYIGFGGSGYAYLPAASDAAAVTEVAASPSSDPTVASVVTSGAGISSGTGDLDAGKTVTLTVNLSEAVTVAGGTPTLTLNDGGTATYSGGSGSNALTFSYTVGAGQNTPDLTVTAVNLNSASVTDAAGNAANLAGAVTNPAGTLPIDTTTPTISSLVQSPASGDLDAGKTVTLTLNLSEAVTVAGGAPTLTLNDGGIATYVSGSGSSALTFSYAVGAGQNTAGLTATAVNLNSASISDGAGNAANLSLSGLTQSGPQIDTTAPTVASVVTSGTGISSGTGDLDAGKTVTLTVNLSEAVTVAGGTPTLTLNDGGTATYSGGSGSNALTFSYTVGAGQNTPDLTVTAVNLNAASVTDAAGNAASLSLAGLTQSGPQIDTTAPAEPVITNDTVNGNDSVTLGGTAEANSTVKIFDGSTELGATTANANGTWNYTTGELSAVAKPLPRRQPTPRATRARPLMLSILSSASLRHQQLRRFRPTPVSLATTSPMQRY